MFLRNILLLQYRLNITLSTKALIRKTGDSMVVAIDSTGLSLYAHTEWNRRKHQKNKVPGH